MNTGLVLCYLALGVLAFILFWRLTGNWRRRLNYDRAMRNPAVVSAVLWWTHELRKATFPSDPASNPTPSIVRTAIAFRTALMRRFATAVASDSEALYDDIGSGSECSSLLADAAAEAGIDAMKCFPPTVRMRFRDYHVNVSRSGGAFWETVWRKW